MGIMDIWTNNRFCINCDIYMNDDSWCNNCDIPNHHINCCEIDQSMKKFGVLALSFIAIGILGYISIIGIMLFN